VRHKPDVTASLVRCGDSRHFALFHVRVLAEDGIQERLPVYFLTELIGLAMGMDVEELQIDRHFVESTMLLEGVGSV
jgi:hypothetical protein